MVAATRVTPKAIKAALQDLEEEIDTRSEALPPDDGLLDEWETRLDGLFDQSRPLRGPSRYSAAEKCRAIRRQLDSLREARDSFRTFDQSTSADLASMPGGFAKLSTLPEAISGALIQPRSPPEIDRALRGRSLPDSTNDGARTAPDQQQSICDRKENQPRRPAPESPGNEVAPAPSPFVDGAAPAAAVLRPAARRAYGPSPANAADLRGSLRTDPIIAYVGRLARRDSFNEARDIACRWLQGNGFHIAAATAAEDFEVKHRDGGQAIAVNHNGIWALQAETPDSRVSGRRWRLETVLIDESAKAPVVSITLYAIGPANQPPPSPTVPKLAGDLIDNIGLIDLADGSTLSTQPDVVETHEAVARLVAQLESPQRQHPVLVVSRYRKDGAEKTILDADKFAASLRGLAHVVVLGMQYHAGWALTDQLTKRFSVFGPAVRLFRPGFTTEDASTEHPYWTHKILAARGLRLRDLQEELLREAASSSLRVLRDKDTIPTFDEVQKVVLKHRLQQAQAKIAQKHGDRSDAARIDELEVALREANSLADLFSVETDELKERAARLAAERDNLNSKVIYLQDRVQTLEQQRDDVGSAKALVLPKSWDNLESWADDYLGDRVILTPKAVRAARNSIFEDVPFAYRVLRFLADTYVPSKRGELEGGNEALESAKRNLGIDVGPVGAAVSAHRSRDTYSTTYRGKRISLDMHVQGPSDRDPRFCFRLYFCWDPDSQCVVVGWFPGHLDNSLS